ncbi:MAG: PAS domain S-box protein, partial [Methanoregula sp.]|nr:PAS domain S-box protein [Methanoregula sp.]
EPYGYIVKPTHSRELNATIEMAMYKHALDQKLKESETKYRTVFENTGTAMVILEENNIISLANKEFEQLSGFSKDDIEGKKIWTEFVVKEDLERMLAQHRLRMQNPEKALTHYEFRAVIKSGDIRTIHVSIELIPGTTKSVASLMDITESKRAEKALRESEQKFRSLVEHSLEGILILDLQGKILFANNAAARMTEADSWTGLIGRNVLEFIAPESREDVIRDFISVSQGHDAYLAQYNAISAKGNKFTVESIGKVISYEGKPADLISIRDITEQKRTEEALRESEHLFRSVGDSLLDPVLILSSEGVVQFTNRAAIQFIGLPDTAIIRGQSFTTYLDGDSRNRVITDLHTIQYLGGPLTAEYCVNPATGEQRWVEACGVRIDYKGSHATLITLHDITERIRVEEVLRGSERQLADIISFLPDATLVIDKNGMVLAWNHAMEKMTGVPAEQMIGKANYEYALPFYHERRPITIDLVLHDDPSVVAKYPVMKKEGRSRRSEIFIPHLNEGRGAHLWFTASPLFDTAGNLMGAIESIRDITEHKQAEEELRKSEERYHNVVEDQTEFICRFLPDGTHIFVNDSYCRYFDRKREEIIGHRFRPVLHPEDREIVARHLTSITPVHPVLNIDQRIIMPDGSTRWQRWSDRAIFDENGRVIEYQSVGRDITEQKRAQEALQRVNKQLNLLASITRHDILNQLLVLKGYIELSRDYLDDKKTLGDFLEKEEKSARTIEEHHAGLPGAGCCGSRMAERERRHQKSDDSTSLAGSPHRARSRRS